MEIISEKAMQARPADRDHWLIESGARGEGRFVGRITPAGARLFYYRYSASSGERVRILIGPYDSRGDGRANFTVQQARDKARELSALYRSGVRDLREHLASEFEAQRHTEELRRVSEKEALREAELAQQRQITVRQLFERWRQTELQPTVRADGKRSGRKDGGSYVSQQFERHVFPTMGDMAAKDVRKADILSLVDAQTSKGQTRTAAVLLSDLRQMMGFALDRELIDVDPLSTIKKARIVGVAVERDRVLSADEITCLARAIPSAGLTLRSEVAIWVLLATGARVGELMGAAWVDALPSDPGHARTLVCELQKRAEREGAKAGIVDLKARTWHLLDTKNQRPHTIHLSDFALQQFTRLAELREYVPESGTLSPWVFPARDATRPVCVKSFGKQLSDRQRPADQRMRGRSKATESLSLPNGRWTAHDLRRTTGTLLAKLGVSSDVIDECLNHMIESRVRRTYIRDRREREQRIAFDALGQELSKLTKRESCSGAQKRHAER